MREIGSKGQPSPLKSTGWTTLVHFRIPPPHAPQDKVTPGGGLFLCTGCVVLAQG